MSDKMNCKTVSARSRHIVQLALHTFEGALNDSIKESTSAESQNQSLVNTGIVDPVEGSANISEFEQLEEAAKDRIGERATKSPENDQLSISDIIFEPVEVGTNINDCELDHFVSVFSKNNIQTIGEFATGADCMVNLNLTSKQSSVNNTQEIPSGAIIVGTQGSVQNDAHPGNSLGYVNIASDSECVGKTGKRKRRLLSTKLDNKIARREGREYTNSKGFQKNKRILGENPCFGRKCTKSVSCHLFTEIDRKLIFESYWKLCSHKQQRDFLLSNIQQNAIERRRKNKQSDRKQITRHFFLPLGEHKHRVCRKFFIATLGVGDKVVRYKEDHKTGINTSKSDNRGKHPPKNKTPNSVKSDAENFIERLPAVPSHYCRSKTTRKYLPVELRNISFVYRLYKKDCIQRSKTSVSVKVFRQIFMTYNIGFHHPKKDKCKFCEKYKHMSPTDKTVEDTHKITEHEREKEASLSAFRADQLLSKTNSEYLCTSFDLQRVLNTPHGNSMLLFYSRKYAVYNLTMYESGTRNGFCYVWGESDGQRGANEICSIMDLYLQEVDKRGINHLLLYCDSCPGQNKNQQMLGTMRSFLTKSVSIQTIKITYLMPGHSFMPADSMHSTIESNYRRKTIWAPSEWPTIIRNARTQPAPYEVKVLSYKDFYDWKEFVGDTSMIRPDGTKVMLRDVRQVSFSKDSCKALVKCSLQLNDSVETEIKQKSKKSPRAAPVKPRVLYTKKLPISSAKYKDLRNLCMSGVIPPCYHDEYLSLKPMPNVPDTLLETDEEDV